MYRRTIAIVAIVMILAAAGSARAADSTPSAQFQSSAAGSQGGQGQACSWPSSPTADRGACNQCAVACGNGQTAVCVPGIVDARNSACVKQPDCTCR